ncbi:MAG TPA: hypothetical protein VFL27_12945 [Candidatus Dormibacteraeota bacterium]|nr:hypothetical protein [Candidatus Dormibacteraeota bacterium]
MAAIRRPTALLVDDDPLSQKAGRARLEHAGYAVLAAGGQAEALSQARQARPDVIYVKLVSPGGNLAFIQALRADDACRHIPIALVREDAVTPNTTLKSVPRSGW